MADVAADSQDSEEGSTPIPSQAPRRVSHQRMKRVVLGYLGHTWLKDRGAYQLPLPGMRVSLKPLTQQRTALLQLQRNHFPSLTELHTPYQLLQNSYRTARPCHHTTARLEDPNKCLHEPAPLRFPQDTEQMMPLQSLTDRPESLAAASSGSHRSDYGTCLPPNPALAATAATGRVRSQRGSTLR